MERSEKNDYNGEVIEEVKLDVFGTKKKNKLPDLQKAIKDAKLLAEKTPLATKKPTPLAPKRPTPVVKKKKVSSVKPKGITRTKPKSVPKKVIPKPVPKKVKPKKVSKPAPKIIKKEPTMEEILKELSFVENIELDPKFVEPDKVSKPVLKESKVREVEFVPFPSKEILLVQSVSNAEDLDNISDLWSRVLIVEKDHPICSKVIKSVGGSLKFQHIKKGTLYASMFEKAIQKITGSLNGCSFKLPFYGYTQNKEKHNFVILDTMYTRIDTAYYVLADVLENNQILQRLILVNADIIFIK